METKQRASRGLDRGRVMRPGEAPFPSRPRVPHTGRGGFTILELMVAIGVLLVATLAAFGAQVTSSQLIGASRDSTVMVNDLELAMEEVLIPSIFDMPGQYPAGTSLANFDDLHLDEERIVPSYPNYSGTGDIPNPLDIVLTARWKDHRGRDQLLTLSTMKSQ